MRPALPRKSPWRRPLRRCRRTTRPRSPRHPVAEVPAAPGSSSSIRPARKALSRSRVETIVAGCTCSYDNAPASITRGKRPTYWNGLRYAVPVDATYAPPAGEDPDAEVQSSQCKVCCRDHHDPDGVDGAFFDPRRGGHETHQLYDSASGELSVAADTGTYTEACRLIRVDGVFRVAADMYDDYMNLLETDNGASDALSDYVPTAAATTHYQNFVLDYLEKKFVNGSTSTYNTVLDPAGTDVTALEEAYSINAPEDPILIERPLVRRQDDRTLVAQSRPLRRLPGGRGDPGDQRRQG